MIYWFCTIILNRAESVSINRAFDLENKRRILKANDGVNGLNRRFRKTFYLCIDMYENFK